MMSKLQFSQNFLKSTHKGEKVLMQELKTAPRAPEIFMPIGHSGEWSHGRAVIHSLVPLQSRASASTPKSAGGRRATRGTFRLVFHFFALFEPKTQQKHKSKHTHIQSTLGPTRGGKTLTQIGPFPIDIQRVKVSIGIPKHTVGIFLQTFEILFLT